ncbi:hypothetical protein Nepgr_002389 [Nepenthes gracilis]|uniref:Uncharacterized protein n=1 Tax=Nepenthes gracilis TaxID=150966 RepID=A0AAD3P7T0_NEPGR|nr:hypothetical protein Nepgr_002389 [Nepenthes gracilis]
MHGKGEDQTRPYHLAKKTAARQTLSAGVRIGRIVNSERARASEVVSFEWLPDSG